MSVCRVAREGLDCSQSRRRAFLEGDGHRRGRVVGRVEDRIRLAVCDRVRHMREGEHGRLRGRDGGERPDEQRFGCIHYVCCVVGKRMA